MTTMTSGPFFGLVLLTGPAGPHLSSLDTGRLLCGAASSRVALFAGIVAGPTTTTCLACCEVAASTVSA